VDQYIRSPLRLYGVVLENCCPVGNVRRYLSVEPSNLPENRFLLIRVVGGGVQTGSTRYVGDFWPIVPTTGHCEDGEFGGMKIGRGNRSTRRKPVPATLCPQEIPLDQTRAAAVGSQRLTLH
jgi:hypothetical protein